VFADQLRYMFQTEVVTLNGNVRFDRLGDIVTGDHAVFNLKNESGTIDSPTYRFRQFHARGQANEMIIQDRDRYRAMRATYTNCDVGKDDWYMKVQRLDIDRLKDVGVAHNATLYFEDVPIMYTPWMDFPLSERRKSGFLPPTFGTSNNTGLEFSLPYYWDIQPNMDYTVEPRAMLKRGVLLGNEFRYLEPDFKGRMQFDFLPHDKETGTDRYALLLLHEQNFRLSRTRRRRRFSRLTPVCPRWRWWRRSRTSRASIRRFQARWSTSSTRRCWTVCGRSTIPRSVIHGARRCSTSRPRSD
jgi:LPS-assembly protein